MSKHTPEPWKDGFLRVTALNGGMRVAVTSCDGGNVEIEQANANRIVDCVNACAGMADPAAEIAELKRKRDELLAALGAAIPLIKQARLDWCDQNAESYDEDVVTPYDAILYRPILSLLETKGSAS